MGGSPPSDPDPKLAARLEALGRELGVREAAHGDELDAARSVAAQLRQQAAAAPERFHAAAAGSGAPHLRVEISEVRPDAKHLRAVEFELARGRHRAIVTSKSRGEVTFVGPFRSGKNEGPCRSLPFADGAALGAALGDLLESFLNEAATP